MTIIHKSSFASYPVGYNPPTQSRTGQREPKTNPVNEGNSGITPSTPTQIENAIAKLGLTKEENSLQNNDRYTNKALQAYNHTRDQPLQAELENIISGVDLYA